ncbi:MAG: hypothetical protein HGA67_00350 [Candidatus Yonathbacteria bacterium]|nr:hypothetical protein [Candidatus Yonathbacteria bacterium]
MSNTIQEKTSYDLGPFSVYYGRNENDVEGNWLLNISQAFLNQLLGNDRYVIGEPYDETSFAKTVIRGVWLDPSTCEYTVCSEIISEGVGCLRFLGVREYRNADSGDHPSMLRGGH